MYSFVIKYSQYLCIYQIHNGPLGNLHIWSTVNNASTNEGLEISVSVSAFTSFGYIHRNGIARL